MRIKKHSTGNQYLLTESNVWVRDFTSQVAPLDINKLSSLEDYSKFIKNETTNNQSDIPYLDVNQIKFNNAVIVSDGYMFKDKQELLRGIPLKTAIIATNRALVKWRVDRKIDYFLVNNPYSECMNAMPSHRYYPKCLASTRTYPEFIKVYKSRGGSVFTYSSAPEPKYISPTKTPCCLDEYRNSICASINFAYRLGVKKLVLFCCDDSFKEERAGAMKLENGLWTYPQQLIPHGIIDGMLHWYKKIKGVKIVDHSSGLVYSNAPYIREDELSTFLSQ